MPTCLLQSTANPGLKWVDRTLVACFCKGLYKLPLYAGESGIWWKILLLWHYLLSFQSTTTVGFLEPSRTNQCNEKEHCHWILTLKTRTNQPTGPVAKRHVWQVPKPESGSPGTGRNGRIPTCHVPKSHRLNAFKCFQTRSKPKSMHSFRNLYVTNSTKDAKAKRVSVVSTIEIMPTRHRLRPVLGTSLVSHLGFLASKVFSEFQGNCRQLVCSWLCHSIYSETPTSDSFPMFAILTKCVLAIFRQ